MSLALAVTSSAIGLLKNPGQAVPISVESQVVSVMVAAPVAIWSPVSHSPLMWS